MGSYTTEERTVAQNKAFGLRKKGYKTTRIIKTLDVDVDKDGKVITENIVSAFGYFKNKNIPREINETEMNKYEFEFVYLN